MSFRVLENTVVWTPRQNRNSDWDGVCLCVWCVWNKLHTSHEPCVRRHRFFMTTKSPTLNTSAFVPSSVWDFEKPGKTKLSCVFVALLYSGHTLTCIVRGLHLHLSTCNCMSSVPVSSIVPERTCRGGLGRGFSRLFLWYFTKLNVELVVILNSQCLWFFKITKIVNFHDLC